MWVSDLALVTRHDYNKPPLGGFVLDAATGEPIDGAKVQVWVRDNRERLDAGRDRPPRTRTACSPSRARPTAATCSSPPTRTTALLGPATYHLANRPHGARRPSEQTVFFTDRSLYRPGQTIQFKGICVRFDQASDKYQHDRQPVAQRWCSTTSNGKEVARQEVRTNDYGSFGGSFTAPRDRLTGGHDAARPGRPPGQTNVSVEEYKRPKFVVTAEAPKEPAKLDGEVKVPGKAVGYTGVPVGGAKVRYRVVREVRYPDWWCGLLRWWRPQPRQGRPGDRPRRPLTTEADGTFTVPFTAKPDQTRDRATDEPTFRYTVHGRRDRHHRRDPVGVAVGRGRLRRPAGDRLVRRLADGREADVKIAVTTTTLDGEGQAAKGTLKVYALKQPDKPARPDVDGGYHPTPRRRGR